MAGPPPSVMLHDALTLRKQIKRQLPEMLSNVITDIVIEKGAQDETN